MRIEPSETNGTLKMKTKISVTKILLEEIHSKSGTQKKKKTELVNIAINPFKMKHNEKKSLNNEDKISIPVTLGQYQVI